MYLFVITVIVSTVLYVVFPNHINDNNVLNTANLVRILRSGKCRETQSFVKVVMAIGVIGENDNSEEEVATNISRGNWKRG